MRVSSLISTIVLLTVVSGYNIVETVIGEGFYSFFQWDAIEDPTHGRVQYVDVATSRRLNLTYASRNGFILRADHTETLDTAGPGRKSVRIRSKKTFTQHIAVFNIRHMPQGCGTWPAIWEVTNSGWPVGGEIDILEGANDQGPNAATLHTTSGCTMPQGRIHKGTSLSFDCATRPGDNQGCAVKFDSKNSYGPAFNNVGGGWYAIERTTNHINIWFWSRSDLAVPCSVRRGAPVADPTKWGPPSASFPSTSCNFKNHFEEHNIIINLTLCGDWAGVTYAGTGCPSTCIDHVNKNPRAFEAAYFDIASLRIYR